MPAAGHYYRNLRGHPILSPLSIRYEMPGGVSLTVDERHELFEQADFSSIDIIEERKKGWICGVGKRP